IMHEVSAAPLWDKKDAPIMPEWVVGMPPLLIAELWTFYDVADVLETWSFDAGHGGDCAPPGDDVVEAVDRRGRAAALSLLRWRPDLRITFIAPVSDRIWRLRRNGTFVGGEV
ncbi:MAG: hypothetical protein WA906_13315, partial [Pacificimonas sp.]